MTHIHWCSAERNECICWWRWHLWSVRSVPFGVLSFTRVNWLRPSDSPTGRHISNDNCFVCVVKKAHSIKLTIVTIFKPTVRYLVSQLCPTLCDLMDGNPRGSSVHGISQARTVEWVSRSFPRWIFPTQGSNLSLLHCRQSLDHWPLGAQQG